MDVKGKEVVAESKILDLGEFGKATDPPEGAWPEIPKFPWFGAEIRVNPNLTDTVLIDFIEEEGELDSRDPAAAVAIKKFVRAVIHPADFDDFWKLGKAHGYSILMFADVAGKIVMEVTGDPTQESSGSSPGQSATGAKSTGGSSQEIQAALEQEGRPDLAEFYLMAREAGVAH